MESLPPSPCVGVCKLERSGVCRGCGRLLDEIAEWPVAGNVRRRAIIMAARQRLAPGRSDKAPRR